MNRNTHSKYILINITVEQTSKKKGKKPFLSQIYLNNY